MDNKQISKHALGFIGGKPTVNCYTNNSKEKHIDVMCCKDSQYSDTNVYASIGLNEMDGNIISDNVSVRIELIGIALDNSDYMGNIIASTAFEIMDNGTFGYGEVIQNVVGEYVQDTNLKHVVLVSPVYWEEYAPLVDKGISVSWLMIVPITDEEKNFINLYGIDAFESRLANSSFDILDMYRSSVV